MPNRDLVVVGAGSYGLVISDLARRCGFSVVGYFDDDSSKWGSLMQEVSVSGPIDESLESLSPGIPVAVAIGDNTIRLRYIKAAIESGHQTPNLISPLSMISDSATIGNGVYLHDASHVWVEAEIGDGSILSPFASVSHHSHLGEGCFVSIKASVGAYVHVERRAFFGMGSVVSPTVHSVGENSLIGAGTIVIHDTEPNGVYVGSPARLLRYRDDHGFSK